MTNLEVIMSNKLFGDNNTDTTNKELSGEDALKLLVGEDGKYKSVEELAKAALHGQQHIVTLEQEAVTLRDAQTKQSSLDDILAAIKTAGNDNNSHQDDNQHQNDTSDKDTDDKIDITKTVETLLNDRDSKNLAISNSAIVKAALSKALGDKAGDVYDKVIKDVGVDLDKLSESSPNAVIKLVLGQGQQWRDAHQTNLPPSTVHGDHNTNQSGELNYTQIQEIAKTSKMSREEKFKLEMSQALKMGDNFFKR